MQRFPTCSWTHSTKSENLATGQLKFHSREGAARCGQHSYKSSGKLLPSTILSTLRQALHFLHRMTEFHVYAMKITQLALKLKYVKRSCCFHFYSDYLSCVKQDSAIQSAYVIKAAPFWRANGLHSHVRSLRILVRLIHRKFVTRNWFKCCEYDQPRLAGRISTNTQ